MSNIWLTGLLAGITMSGIIFTHASGKTAGSGDKHTGKFMAQPVTIDGDDAEWPSPYPYYDSKARVSYAIANDRKNLYITIKASDPQIQHKLLVGGMKVWIDPEGKKDEEMGIDYPQRAVGGLPTEEDKQHPQAIEERPLTRDSSEHRRPPVHIPGSFGITGFTACTGTFDVQKANGCGITVRMGVNAYNELVWEASIPLSALYKDSSSALAGAPVSVAFEIGGLPVPAKDANGPMSKPEDDGNTNGMMRPNGSMGINGGRSRNAMLGEGGPDMDVVTQDEMTETTRTWVKTRIATP